MDLLSSGTTFETRKVHFSGKSYIFKCQANVGDGIEGWEQVHEVIYVYILEVSAHKTEF